MADSIEDEEKGYRNLKRYSFLFKKSESEEKKVNWNVRKASI